jgi:hypothetical protein
MAIIVRVLGELATVEDLEWECDDPTVLAILNSYLPFVRKTPDRPWPDMDVVEAVLGDFPGRIIYQDKPPQYDADTLY